MARAMLLALGILTAVDAVVWAQSGSPGLVPMLPAQSEGVGPPAAGAPKTAMPTIPAIPASAQGEAVGPPAGPPTFPAPPPQPAYPAPAPPPYFPAPYGDPGVLAPAPVVLRPVYNPDAYTIWMRAELLVWWVKNAPQPINVVSAPSTTSPNLTPLGTSGDLGTFSGFRFGIGGWLETNHNIGVEANFFAIDNRSSTFNAFSDAGGNPVIGFPFNNQTPGSVGPAIMPITSPGAFSGGLSVSSNLSLWGTDINGIFRIAKISDFEFTLLAGFRYLDLIENLNVFTSSQSIADGTLTNLQDNFGTRNQFYGGQLGGRFTWTSDRLSFDLTGKLALGVTHEVLDVQGTTIQYPGYSNVPNFFPGGFFAQQSNMGRTAANQFGVIPTVELKINYAVAPWCKLFIGYDFLYWNQVIRPGSNVDHNINLSQSQVLGTGTLAGAASPAPMFNRTDFWAQGLTLGVEFHY